MDGRCSKLEYVNSNSQLVSVQLISELARIDFATAKPVRAFPTYRGKKNYNAMYVQANLRTTIGFESRIEGLFLLQADWENDAASILSQPFCLHWKRQPIARHIPDYFVRLRNGDGVVVDVRPSDRLNERTVRAFQLTEKLCQQVGWRFRHYDAPSSELVANLKLIRGYASFPTVDDDVVRDLLRTAQVPVTLAELERHSSTLGVGTGIIRGTLLALLWHRRLRADLSESPGSNTKVWTW